MYIFVLRQALVVKILLFLRVRDGEPTKESCDR